MTSGTDWFPCWSTHHWRGHGGSNTGKAPSRSATRPSSPGWTDGTPGGFRTSGGDAAPKQHRSQSVPRCCDPLWRSRAGQVSAAISLATRRGIRASLGFDGSLLATQVMSGSSPSLTTTERALFDDWRALRAVLGPPEPSGSGYRRPRHGWGLPPFAAVVPFRTTAAADPRRVRRTRAGDGACASLSSPAGGAHPRFVPQRSFVRARGGFPRGRTAPRHDFGGPSCASSSSCFWASRLSPWS